MDFNEDNNVETSYGHCRCCLEEGHHRDMTKVYGVGGHTEVYTDMFLDCFNVFLSSNVNLSSLICLSCVEQLRSACAFKRLVLRTEARLTEELQNGDHERLVLVNVPVAKETLDTTIGFKIQVHQEKTQAAAPPPPPVEHPPEPEPKVLAEPGDQQAQESSSDDEAEFLVYSPAKDKLLHKRSIPNVKKREKMVLVYNTTTLLENCNATLFKSKIRDGFPCFYCRDLVDSFEELRQHQIETHTRNNLAKVLKTYTAESLVVYADVTDLQCTLCCCPMQSLKDLRSHLEKTHHKQFYSKATDRVVPYKLLDNYFECQICSFNFETFGAIERHMNTHFRNYVCDVCGGGFVTMLRLKNHLHALHKEGTFPCEFCDKVFTTQLRHKGHVDFVHRNVKKLKCQKCSARFSDYFVQKKHMVDVHGELPIVYRCNVCSRSFNRRYTLSCHMKRHLEQKDVECDQCTYTCYNKTELKEHMLKHTKHSMEGSFRCTICDKNYSRKKTLREHMKIHEDDRRFVCQICEQAFVQSSSLKTHMRNHHSILL